MTNQLLNHYKLIQKRGLITPETTFSQFMDKLNEEWMEVCNAYADCIRDGKCPSDDLIYEMTDLLLVITNCFQHYGIDLSEQIAKNCKVQEGRIV